MFHQHFLSAPGIDPGPLDSGERVLWRGRCAVAEYAFDEASSLPRWTLPEETEVLVTDRRVRYTYADGNTLSSGELFWLWPQHLRVQPGNRDTGRTATVTQIQLVCNGPEGSYPALVFAGGDLATVGDADRLANVLRQAIARFRVENATEIGVAPAHARMLSRLVIGPEFSNYQGGEGQTVSLLGSVQVPGPEPEPAEPIYAEATYDEPAYTEPAYQDQPAYQEQQGYQEPVYAEPVYQEQNYQEQSYQQPVYQEQAYQEPVYQDQGYEQDIPVSSVPISSMPTSGNRGYVARPGVEADAMRAEEAKRAELDSRYSQPDLASRASTLAARVASLMSSSDDEEEQSGLTRLEGRTTNLSTYLNRSEDPHSRR
ncbi:translation initiation factor 2 [Actinoplanes awajinensis]|uniref:Translation initiation factor 2 n=1 Tax=Actinoplanes awajinensis subsp. mycoplanecinus TaxID=135947 RepID=A0A117MQ32_9ACTN|nr:translation initiation factor 2 [Actinoplanes awajinensis]KUL29559.1 translation initiation factor 2 [Actinoplanes awajinensis subsp. mycoplanecinus]